MEPNRARARELAAEHLAKGDPTGWFEQLYLEAEHGDCTVPWADLRPNPNLIEFWGRHPLSTAGKTALEIGCGLGDNAEQLAAWGFETTAFDISSSAIRACRQRFPASPVRYLVADLFAEKSIGSFDFVLECYTLQVLPASLREQAIERTADLVATGGFLLLIARGREEQDPEGQMPWPLTRRELAQFSQTGLEILSLEDYFDRETPPVRRFRVLYWKRPTNPSSNLGA